MSSASSDFGSGVVASDLVVQAYHAVLHNSLLMFRNADEVYLSEEVVIRERLSTLEKLAGNVHEERRILELQLQEVRNQSHNNKKKSGMMQAETTRMNNILSQQLGQLDADERQLEEQQRSIASKINEILTISASLEEKLQECQREEKLIEKQEYDMYHKEQDFEKAKVELAQLDAEIDARRRNLERRDEGMVSWNRTLDARDAELARCQQQYRDDLGRLERREAQLGIQPATNAHGQPQVITSQRHVMDDHDMTIDRDDDEDLMEDEENDR